MTRKEYVELRLEEYKLNVAKIIEDLSFKEYSFIDDKRVDVVLLKDVLDALGVSK